MKPHIPKASGPRTIDDFIADLEAQNRTQADWAREHGFSLGEVYMLTRGRTQGRRGKARDILIAMGVEPPPMFGARTGPLSRTNARPRVLKAA